MKKIIKIHKSGVNNFVLNFDKVGQDIEWLGILDARKMGVYELVVEARHLMPNTRGRVTVRAVVGKGSKVKLRGIIKISKEAQGTDDFLELRVLTLDKTALATADPELEIEANDVRAGHAASVGPVDPGQILYLMSKGLDKDEAERKIVEGWLGV